MKETIVVILLVLLITTCEVIDSNNSKRDVCVKACEDKSCELKCIKNYSLVCNNGIFVGPTCDKAE